MVHVCLMHYASYTILKITISFRSKSEKGFPMLGWNFLRKNGQYLYRGCQGSEPPKVPQNQMDISFGYHTSSSILQPLYIMAKVIVERIRCWALRLSSISIAVQQQGVGDK